MFHWTNDNCLEILQIEVLMTNSKISPLEFGAVVFDYGSVLCPPPPDRDIEAFAALAGLSAESFRELYEKTRSAYDRGTLSSNEYWLGFGKVAGHDYDEERIRALEDMDLSVWSILDQRMIEMAARLQKSNVKTAILSNMQPYLRDAFREKDWLRHFDVQIFSCDLGLIKPEREIYQRLLDALEVPPQRVLFIDDLPKNIEAARKVGIHGIVYRSFDELDNWLKPLFAGGEEN